ncbi:MAG TPA: hypothetical protein QF772_01870 [Nitrospinaceae bacterium]|jgi:hypothetical protein|nr:hypothetical protein [Nitrospinota bacterium]MDP6334994.1 hypothetical protein [Nitrospinaceae bacterium]HAX45576.1 hypothetical protein [Nitrospina sp.]MDP7148573.1 hypothetical protein [Nitrospinaceae bacterium]MDP7611043.1 hypothetical protein [Nitrospinaceae bacterium]|tara:strand:+ start:2121 stop:2957 length:837 start_codon:yes stop_codon:yes gene_type:complete
MFRHLILAIILLLAGVLPACGDTEQSQGPVVQPKKESTWVRTKKVRTTKDEFFSGEKKPLAEIPINTSLAKKLASPQTGSKKVTDVASCLARLKPLDLRRTAVQKSGGMWGAFERSPDAKPYSFNGMQLDSNMNKLVFGLRHLCKTSEGVPLNEVANDVGNLLEANGREKAEKILVARGEHPADVEKLLNYAKTARKESDRKVSFNTISSSFDRAESLIDLYEELSKRSVDENSKTTFISEGVTLLKVLNDFIQTDKIMVMALNEDDLVPYHHIDQDM